MVDFLSNHDGLCQPVATVDFRICDDSSHPYAYLGMSASDRGCEVANPQRRAMTFRPVDRALYTSADACRCDALLRTDDMSQFYFVELKDWNAPGWYRHGVEQVSATVNDFNHAHPGVLMAAHKRAAYVVNLRRRGFSRAHAQIMRDFAKKHHVILRETRPIRVA